MSLRLIKSQEIFQVWGKNFIKKVIFAVQLNSLYKLNFIFFVTNLGFPTNNNTIKFSICVCVCACVCVCVCVCV